MLKVWISHICSSALSNTLQSSGFHVLQSYAGKGLICVFSWCSEGNCCNEEPWPLFGVQWSEKLCWVCTLKFKLHGSTVSGVTAPSCVINWSALRATSGNSYQNVGMFGWFLYMLPSVFILDLIHGHLHLQQLHLPPGHTHTMSVLRCRLWASLQCCTAFGSPKHDISHPEFHHFH